MLALGALNSTGGFFASFNNSIGFQTGTPTAIGAAVHTRASGNGFQVGLIKAASGTSVFDTSKVYTTNDTVFVVGSYTINTSSTSDDQAKLWINPDPATFGATSPPPATLTTATGNDISANQIASFVFLSSRRFLRATGRDARGRIARGGDLGWSDAARTRSR